MKKGMINCLAVMLLCSPAVGQIPAKFTVSGQIAGKSSGDLFMLNKSLPDHPAVKISVDGNGHFYHSDTLQSKFPIEYVLIDPEEMTLFKGGAMAGKGPRFLARSGDHIVIEGIQGRFNMAKVSGNSYNDKLMELQDRTGVFQKQEDLIWDQVKAAMKQGNLAVNRPKVDSLSNLTDPIQDQINSIKLKFVKSNSDNFVSAIVLADLNGQIPAGEMEAAYNGLAREVQQSVYGQHILDELGRKMAEADAQSGKPAADFAKRDKDGNMIKLSDYRGKYVLLDFWGSWCGPCRASHPHLRELKEKYGRQGLVIIGIAEERTKNKTAWLAAIKEDGLTWTQIMNDEGKDGSDVVKLYGIQGFPTKILIDRDGNIITRVTGTTMAGAATVGGHPPAPAPAGGSTASSTAATSATAASAASAGASSTASASAGTSSASAATPASGVNANAEPPNNIDIKLKEIFKN
jgi:thiol-disulfide isomerase/thioredoxin